MRVERAAGALGAFVHDVQVADAIESDALFDSIRAALLEHQVLFLRDQQMTPQQQRAFAVRFGPIEGHPAYGGRRNVRRTDPREHEGQAVEDRNVAHRHDVQTAPPMLTMLHGKVIPPFGGDTLFAGMTAAFGAVAVDARRS